LVFGLVDGFKIIEEALVCGCESYAAKKLESLGYISVTTPWL